MTNDPLEALRSTRLDRSGPCPEGYRKTLDGRCVLKESAPLRQTNDLSNIQAGKDLAAATDDDPRTVPSPGTIRHDSKAAALSALRGDGPVGDIPQIQNAGQPEAPPSTTDLNRQLLDAPQDAFTQRLPAPPPADIPAPTASIGRSTDPVHVYDMPDPDAETGFNRFQVAYDGFRDGLKELSVLGHAIDAPLALADNLQRDVANLARRASGGMPITDEELENIESLMRKAHTEFPKSAMAGQFVGAAAGIIADLVAVKATAGALAPVAGARGMHRAEKILEIAGRWNQPTRTQAALVGAAEEAPIQAALAMQDRFGEHAGIGAALGAAAGALVPGSRAFRAAQDAAEAGKAASARTLREGTTRVPDVDYSTMDQRVANAAAENALAPTVRQTGDFRVSLVGEEGQDEVLDLPLLDGMDELDAELAAALNAPSSARMFTFELTTGDTTIPAPVIFNKETGHLNVAIPEGYLDPNTMGARAVRDAGRDIIAIMRSQGMEPTTIGGIRTTGARAGQAASERAASTSDVKFPVDRFMGERTAAPAAAEPRELPSVLQEIRENDPFLENAFVTRDGISSPSHRVEQQLREAGVSTPRLREVGEPSEFHAAISESVAKNKHGAAVHVYSPEEYADMRLFLTGDGSAGYALKGDDIVSVFKTPGSPHKKWASYATTHAISQGGRRLDAYDGALPNLYAPSGFEATGRVPFNEEFMPTGWNLDEMGKPDIVGMAYNPRASGAYVPGSGKQFGPEDYDIMLEANATAARNNAGRALDKIPAPQISLERLRTDPRAGYLLMPDLSGVPRYAAEAARATRRQGQRLAEVEVRMPGTRPNTGTSIRREFMSQGDLPEEAFRLKIKQDAWTRAAMRRGEYMLREWDKTVEEIMQASHRWGITSEADIDTMLNTVLIAEGRTPMATLPAPLRPLAMEMRDFVDTLSQKLIDDGVVQGPLAATVEANKGIYLNRAYRVHHDPSWIYQNIDEGIRNRAIEYIRAQPAYADLTESELEGQIRKLLDLEVDSPFHSARVLGSKDINSLRKRMLEARPIRELLGEVEEGRQNFARSTLNLTRLVGNHNFLTEVKAAGLKGGWFREHLPDARLYREVAAEGSDVMFPLNGVYTSPEIARAFADAVDNRVGDWAPAFYMKGVGLVKYGKTVLSVQTHVRNFISASMFAVANGHVFNKKVWNDLRMAQGSVQADMGIGKRSRGSAQAISTEGSRDVARQMEEARAMGVEPRREWFGSEDVAREDIVELATNGGLDIENSKHMLTLMNRLQEIGVTFESVRAGELGDVMREAMKGDDPIKRFQGFLGGPISKVANTAAIAYRAEDDFWKVMSFLNEYRRYRAALPESITNAEVERRVADIVRNQIPTYSLVPQIATRFRRNPVVGPFVAFTSEIIRTTANINKQWITEMGSSNPEIRKIGAQRMAGVTLAATGTAAVAEASRRLIGISDDTENDFREGLPPWSKNSELVWIGWDKDAGTVQYVDISYSDPYNYLKRPLIAMWNGDDPKEVLAQSIAELGGPFFSPEILSAVVFQLMSNKTASGRQIYNTTETPAQQHKAMMKHFVDELKPGTVSSVERIAKGYGWIKDEGGRSYDGHAELLATVFGMRISTLDFHDMIFFRGLELSKKLQESNQRVFRTAYSDAEVAPEKLADAFQKSADARRNQLEAYSRVIHTARVAGLSDFQIREDMRRAGVPSAVLEDLLRGQFRAYAPNILGSGVPNEFERSMQLFDLRNNAPTDLSTPRRGIDNSTPNQEPEDARESALRALRRG